MNILSTLINRIKRKSKVDKVEEEIDFYQYFESELTAINDTIGFTVSRLKELKEEIESSGLEDKESRESELNEIKGLFDDSITRLKKLERNVKGSIYKKPDEEEKSDPLTKGKGR